MLQKTKKKKPTETKNLQVEMCTPISSFTVGKE